MLVGNLGSSLSTLGVLQLGGPPAYPSATWTRALPKTALPYLGHVYGEDGVTFVRSLGQVVSRQPITYQQTNGSYAKLVIDLPTGLLGGVGIYGTRIFGSGTYGGSAISLGNVVKITEQGGDGTVIYAGVINSMPETISPTGTTHQVELTPFAFQLSDAYVQNNYTTPTDIAVMIRDAIAVTPYCHCDQVSVPMATGITAIADFRNRPAIDVLNTVKHIAGYSWYWHVGATGRVWFQPMGSGAGGAGGQVYTAKLGIDYSSRAVNGGDLSSLKNDILAVGGMTPSNLTAAARYTGSSQATLGTRSLNPPLSFPQITDLGTLQKIVTGVGALLDRVWNRSILSLLPAFGQRINCEQPGGAMIRYIEPLVNAMPESSVGIGSYVGPYIVQNVTLDGALQTTTSGDTPVADVHDFDNLAAQVVAQTTVAQITNPKAPLTTPH